MDALFDVLPFLVFALIVLVRLVRAGVARAGRSTPVSTPRKAAASSGSGFDLNALLQALEAASTPTVTVSPPPLPAAAQETPPLEPSHFDESHFTEDDPFTEPGIFREVHLPKALPRPAPGPAPRSTKPGTAALQTRLRDPAALREAVVLQTILERRRR